MQPFTCSMLSLLAIISFSISFNFTICLATSRFRLESDSDTNTDFIKASCDTTRYADLCFKTLSPYADTIQKNPMELANVALTVCLKSAKSTSKSVRQLSKGRDLTTRDGQAIADCLENMSDSVDEMKKSMVALKGLDGPDFMEKMGNVKTWVSAAMTDEDTCMDGVEENFGNKMKETIRGYIVSVAELTSIALSLITNLSST
uniref:pectinesterase inhibitor 7-like n=1 Tax=Erigeron canadensis TaxID=72917 RepID=UPI001CB9B2CD|nr:pectinesterase inhibitor 7-like [Erigeron canadensis]